MPIVAKIICKTINSGDFSSLTDFTEYVVSGSYYTYAGMDLSQAPGFMYRNLSLTDNANGQSFVMEVAFENWDTFNAYMTDKLPPVLELYQSALGKKHIVFEYLTTEVIHSIIG